MARRRPRRCGSTAAHHRPQPPARIATIDSPPIAACRSDSNSTVDQEIRLTWMPKFLYASPVGTFNQFLFV